MPSNGRPGKRKKVNGGEGTGPEDATRKASCQDAAVGAASAAFDCFGAEQPGLTRVVVHHEAAWIPLLSDNLDADRRGEKSYTYGTDHCEGGHLKAAGFNAGKRSYILGGRPVQVTAVIPLGSIFKGASIQYKSRFGFV
jgi:hypothetical protein